MTRLRRGYGEAGVGLAQNFTGVYGDLVLNCCMIRRPLAVAVGLFAVCFPVVAQQANRPKATEHRAVAPNHLHVAGAVDPAFALNLYRPKTLSAKDNSLLFHKGPVMAWSDGGRLASENAMTNMGMVSVDLGPLAYSPPNVFSAAPTKNGSVASNSRPENFGPDAKDSPEMMVSPSDRIYYGGEIGFMYGQWSGKGGGDMMQSYILGQVGNDHFQITAGAAYEDSSGHTSRFHSFVVPR
jgi:hypothetical protein